MQSVAKKLLFLIAFSGCLNSLHAQDLNKGFFPLEHEELAGKSVTCIFKDSRGFMWFGTSEGLSRFDGTNVKFYKNNPDDSKSISNNDIHAIVEDYHHNLWVGTADGVNFYDRGNDSFLNVDSLSKNGKRLTIRFITALACDANDNIWIGTIGGGVNIFNTVSGQLIHKFSNSNSKDNYVPSDYVTGIAVSGDNAWVGTRAGVKVFDTRTLALKTFDRSDEKILNGEVTCVISGGDNNVILGFADGEVHQARLDRHRLQTSLFVRLDGITGAASYIHGLCKDEQGNIWVTTEKSGLALVDRDTHHITQFIPEEGNRHSAPAHSMRTIYIDDNQQVWVGTYNLGVYSVDPRMQRFELYQRNPFKEESLHGDNVRAVAEDSDGNLWIAGSGGVSKLNMKERRIMDSKRVGEGLERTLIKDVLVDSQNNIWIGTRDDGILKINLGTFKRTRFDVTSAGTGNNKIVCIYEDRTGTIWAGTLGSGLFYFDRSTSGFVSLSEPNKPDNIDGRAYVTSIEEGIDGTLWVCTLDGLYALTRKGERAFDYKLYYRSDRPGSISSSRVVVAHRDIHGCMWFGTFDNGLNKFNPGTKTFEAFTEKNGLANNSIAGILSDAKGNLWISSTSGISKFDPVTRLSKNYSKADGLNSNNFNVNACLQVSSGHFVFGGDNGFNIFHPDSIRNTEVPPLMYITDLRINNVPAQIGQEDSPLSKHIGLTDRITLEYNQRSFAIDFVALNYGPPAKNQYCYKLEGFEDRWNCVGSNHVATYTNIDPGRYVFLVRGSNSDGVWSDAPARLDVTVLPPLWGTWWAILSYCIVFSLIAYLLIRFRIMQIRVSHQLKLEKIAREKEHELTESKMNFFTNVSHELRTPLSLILGPLENMVSSPGVPANTKKSLSIAYRNASNLAKLVNELMDFSKFDEVKPSLTVQRGEIVSFVSDIAGSFGEVSERKNISLVVQPSIPEVFGWFDGDKLEKIVRNLLSNAFKFTLERGEISILINVDGGQEDAVLCSRQLEIVVTDTGVGIAAEELPFIFKKFYQAKSTSGVSKSGTGIGLALTKALVEVHRGTIGVESAPGRGTKFTVALPIDKACFTAGEIIEAPAGVIAGEEESVDYDSIVIDTSIGKPELLVVEDNDELREFLVSEFNPEFSVTQAANAEDGFIIACNKVPDLIISDIVLPGKSGICLCREVKSDLRTSHIPVLLLTAKASAEDQVAGLESGADVYMPKPFSLRVLKTHVKQIVAMRRKLYSRFSQEAHLMPAALTDNSIDREFLQKVVDFIEANLLNTQLSVEAIADLFNVSRSQVYRKIKALTDHTVVEFIRTVRLKHALKLMEEKRFTLSEVAYQTGFNSLSYFTRCFKNQYGKAPSEYVGGSKND